jgi:hypothetical protein
MVTSPWVIGHVRLLATIRAIRHVQTTSTATHHVRTTIHSTATTSIATEELAYAKDGDAVAPTVNAEPTDGLYISSVVRCGVQLLACSACKRDIN